MQRCHAAVVGALIAQLYCARVTSCVLQGSPFCDCACESACSFSCAIISGGMPFEARVRREREVDVLVEASACTRPSRPCRAAALGRPSLAVGPFGFLAALARRPCRSRRDAAGAAVVVGAGSPPIGVVSGCAGSSAGARARSSACRRSRGAPRKRSSRGRRRPSCGDHLLLRSAARGQGRERDDERGGGDGAQHTGSESPPQEATR